MAGADKLRSRRTAEGPAWGPSAAGLTSQYCRGFDGDGEFERGARALLEPRARQLDEIAVFFVVGLDARRGLLGSHIPGFERRQPALHVRAVLRILDFGIDAVDDLSLIHISEPTR